MVQDPTTGFFRIGWIDFEILFVLVPAQRQRIAESINDETTLSVATSTRCCSF
jgi:hypothetical protein